MIMDALLACLKTKRMSDIKVTDLTRMNGMVHSHFYAYFRSLDEVVLALARQVTVCPPSLVVHAQQDWSGPNGRDHVRNLVREYMEIWRDKRELLRSMLILADEIGGEFLLERVNQYSPLLQQLEAKVAATQAAGMGLEGLAPSAVAFKLVTLLGSAGNGYEAWRSSGFSDEQLVETTAQLMHLVATGQTPTSGEVDRTATV